MKLIFLLIACFIRNWRKLYKADKTHAILLPPTDSGSLGDEAMLVAAVDHLDQHQISGFTILAYHSSISWSKHKDLKPYPVRHLCIGSIVGRLKLLWLFTKSSHFFIFGADVLDGYYSESGALKRLGLLNLAAQSGLVSTAFGFSINEHLPPKVLDAFQSLPDSARLCTRDPISHQRLSSLLNRPVLLTADLAFLLQPIQSDLTKAIQSWIALQHSQGKIIIGINANALTTKDTQDSKKELYSFTRLTQQYANLMAQLAKILSPEKLAFILIPHDFRELNEEGIPSDRTVSKAIYTELSNTLKHITLLPEESYSASEAKEITRHLNICVSGRMHLAIACLGNTVPVACITYQGKFEGLFKHLDLQPLTVSPQDAFASDQLLQKVVDIIHQESTLKQHISTQLPKIRLLSLNNFPKLPKT